MAVRIEKKGKVWTVIHSRAEARNAMDPESADALVGAFQEFDGDPNAAVAVLWGEGGAFCAGWDLKYCATMVKDAKQLHEIDYPLDDRKAASTSQFPRGPLGPTRLELDKPVIAAVAGPAVAGGFELALWCDLRIGTETARLGFPERRWGVPLIDGGTQRLPRIVGMGRALDLILTGRIVEADEALAMGLLTELVPAGKHLERSLEMAEGLASFPQETMLADRRSALEGFGLTLTDGLAREAEIGSAVSGVGVEGAKRFASGEGRGGAGAGV
jgi:enoyl-CoA hydratase/carnithine racemase